MRSIELKFTCHFWKCIIAVCLEQS